MSKNNIQQPFNNLLNIVVAYTFNKQGIGKNGELLKAQRMTAQQCDEFNNRKKEETKVITLNINTPVPTVSAEPKVEVIKEPTEEIVEESLDEITDTHGEIEITVTGALENYNGLAEIVASDIKLNSSGNTLITPVDVSVLDESTESQFIRMTNWTIVDGSQWLGNGSSFNVDISDGTNTYQMRIDGDTELSTLPIPTGDIFNFTGIGGQFDNMEPWNEGYQIFPRYISDIEGFVSTINPELGNYIKFYPNPTSDVLQIRSDIQLDNIRITNMLGQQVIDLPKPNLSETVNVNNWQTGIYVITFITGNEIWTSQFVKK